MLRLGIAAAGGYYAGGKLGAALGRSLSSDAEVIAAIQWGGRISAFALILVML